MSQAARLVTAVACLLNLQGPAWPAPSPALSAAPGLRFFASVPPARFRFPRRQAATVEPNDKRSVTNSTDGNRTIGRGLGGVGRLTYAYCPSSTVVTDALGKTTRYDSQALQGLRKTSGVVDPANGRMAFTYDAVFNLTGRTDQAGRATAFNYDERGNVLSIIDPALQANTFSYEPVFDNITSVTDPRGNPTTLEHDARGNLTRVADALGNATVLAYDARGHVLSVSDPRLKTTAFTYDANGGLATVTDPMSRATSMTQDAAGRVTQAVDPSGKATAFQYDAESNLTRVTDALNGITGYAYTAGREASVLGTVTDARGHATVFGYDGVSRLTSVTNALGQAKRFSYDLKGNLLSATNARGSVISFTYDNLDRLTTKALPAGTVTYQYDAVGNLTQTTHHNGSALALTYDARDRVTQVVETLPGGVGVTLSYAYDANGNRTGLTTPWGSFVYSYDALNRLTRIENPWNRSYVFEYDELGRRTRLSYPNNVETLYSFDDASQLEHITHKLFGQVFAEAHYAYDAAGNRATMADLFGTHQYAYDGLHRLTSAAHPADWPLPAPSETFSYDAVGNRLADNAISGYSYDNANRLLENSSFTYAYDSDGNTTGQTDKATNLTTLRSYDSENQLTAVGLPDGSGVSFKYDALGRRVEKSVQVGTTTMLTRFVYDNEDVIAILDAANNPILIFTHGPGIDEPLGIRQAADGTEYFAHADGLGSIVAHTDASGAVVERMFYESYGKPLFVDLTEGTPVVEPQSLTGSPYAYAGTLRDQEINSNHMGRREQDPDSGRFIQEDPIGFAGGDVNLFAYAANSPTNNIDPRGTDIIHIKVPIPFLHEEIWIGDDKHGFVVFGFAPSTPGRELAAIAPIDVQGKVFIRPQSLPLNPGPLLKVLNRRVQSRREDERALVKAFKFSKQDQWQTYRLRSRDCRNFAGQLWEDLNHAP